MKPELDLYKKIQGKEDKGEVLTSYTQKEAAACLSGGFFFFSFLLNLKDIYIYNQLSLYLEYGRIGDT